MPIKLSKKELLRYEEEMKKLPRHIQVVFDYILENYSFDGENLTRDEERRTHEDFQKVCDDNWESMSKYQKQMAVVLGYRDKRKKGFEVF